MCVEIKDTFLQHCTPYLHTTFGMKIVPVFAGAENKELLNLGVVNSQFGPNVKCTVSTYSTTIMSD
jgi:hypothetical protein